MAKAVLFDVDDTLIPTSDFIELVLYQSVVAMINHGLPETNPTQALQRLHEIRRQNRERTDKDFDLLCHYYGVNDIDIIRAGVERYSKIKHAALQTNSHAKKILEDIAENGYKLGVVTTGDPIKQSDKIRVVGLEETFGDFVYASTDPEVVKPNPRLFRQALNDMGANPKESFYIGNRLDVDIIGAHNAEMKAILLKCGKYAGQTPTSLLLKKGYKADDIIAGRYKNEIVNMTPEHTIISLDEIKGIIN